MTLALLGGTPEIQRPIQKFNTIGQEEITAAITVCKDYPLSGFIGGNNRGGYWVSSLEERWQKILKVKHAVACNSATSGLLAACVATGVNSKSHVLTTPFTMSATSAVAVLLGAKITFHDIEDKTFNLKPDAWDMKDAGYTHCIIANIFGHPARLEWWRKAADTYGFILIEDNAQSPFATIGGHFAGTVGHVGVFSLNVHKHIQCGEGGIIVTNDDKISEAARNFINHGELAGGSAGLNLRMTEVTAAIAHAQLNKAPSIIWSRIRQAEALTAAASGFDWITPPVVQGDCVHVYYAWAGKIHGDIINLPRNRITAAIEAEGLPIKGGYQPLHHLIAFKDATAWALTTTNQMHDRELAIIENCTYTFTEGQIEQFTTILKKIENHRNALRFP